MLEPAVVGLVHLMKSNFSSVLLGGKVTISEDQVTDNIKVQQLRYWKLEELSKFQQVLLSPEKGRKKTEGAGLCLRFFFFFLK